MVKKVVANVRFEKTENCNIRLMRVGTKWLAAVGGVSPTPELSALLIALRRLNPHVASWK